MLGNVQRGVYVSVNFRKCRFLRNVHKGNVLVILWRFIQLKTFYHKMVMFDFNMKLYSCKLYIMYLLIRDDLANKHVKQWVCLN